MDDQPIMLFPEPTQYVVWVEQQRGSVKQNFAQVVRTMELEFLPVIAKGMDHKLLEGFGWVAADRVWEARVHT
jgi:hypothetical protein